MHDDDPVREGDRKTDWFSKETLSDRLSRISEPHVHPFFRANMFHVVGRDADLIVDFGMGLASLRGMLDIAPGKPVIAVVDGPVIAAGVSLVTFCDLCVATDRSTFVYPEARLGNAAGLIASITSRIPHKLAMELMLLGRPVSAQRAYETGFVNRLCTPGDEMAIAMELAHDMADSSPTVMRFLKQLAKDTLPQSPVETMVNTQMLAQDVALSDDAVEGVDARRARRAPRFPGF